MKFGYTLSTEEHNPKDLVAAAVRAEESGFDFLGISDHFHPWTRAQGQSPFSWSVIGAIAQATNTIQVFSEVVCPIMRYHPAIVAQAAATSQILLDGRYSLGLGTGEALNEHVTGEGWPHSDIRRAMLEEAIEIIRALWTGKQVSLYGQFFSLEAARLFTLPDTLPPMIISAFGPKSAELAGRVGDGFVSAEPDKQLVEMFRSGQHLQRPTYAQLDVSFDTDAERAAKRVKEQWPQGGVAGQAITELRLPQYFEQAAKPLTVEQVSKDVVCGNTIEDYLKQVRLYRDAGYDHIYFHNIGADQQAFLAFAYDMLL